MTRRGGMSHFGARGWADKGPAAPPGSVPAQRRMTRRRCVGSHDCAECSGGVCPPRSWRRRGGEPSAGRASVRANTTVPARRNLWIRPDAGSARGAGGPGDWRGGGIDAGPHRFFHTAPSPPPFLPALVQRGRGSSPAHNIQNNAIVDKISWRPKQGHCFLAGFVHTLDKFFVSLAKISPRVPNFANP